MPEKSNQPQTQRREPLLPNLLFNILLPIVLLRKGDDWFGWSPTYVLMLALAFPLGYGIRDRIVNHRVNLFSIVGLVSILLTGVVGVLRLPPIWLALKEAAVPAVLGAAVLYSMKTRYPLVRTLIYNPQVIQVDKVEDHLKLKGSKAEFDKTLAHATYYLGASFFLSAVLNFVLARVVVRTHPAIDAAGYNQELASMYAWSYVVIVVPSMVVMMVALWVLIRGIRIHTGLTLEDVIQGGEPPIPDKKSEK